MLSVVSCVPDSEQKTTRARMAARSIPDSIAESQILSRLLLGEIEGILDIMRVEEHVLYCADSFSVLLRYIRSY